MDPLEEVVNRLRDTLQERRVPAIQRVERIKAAADEYLRAVEADLAADIAARVGLEGPRTASQSVKAALTLRNLVNELPEVHVRIDVPRQEPPRADPRPYEPRQYEAPRVEAPRPEIRPEIRPEPRYEHEESYSREPAAPEVVELYREFREADLESCPVELFKPYAEEYAARVRYQQAMQPSDPDDLLGKTIRALTRIAGDRNVRDVFGLSRNHVANWQVRAEQARKERERVIAAGPRKPPAPKAEAPRPATNPLDETPDLPQLPHIAQLMQLAPIVLLGGIIKADKLERLRRHLGDNVEWETTDSNSSRSIHALERRIRDGRVGAVIVLDELLGHRHFEPVVDAARASGIPLSYGAKAGKASILAALQEIETMLSQRGHAA